MWLRHHFCPALRKKIKGGKILKHPYRIGRAQDRDSARETDALRSCRRRSENDRRRGIEVVATVVFANSKYI